MELGLIPSSYFHFKQNLNKMAKESKDIVADVMGGAKKEPVKAEVKKEAPKKEKEVEKKKEAPKAKKEVAKYLILAGAVSLDGKRIAKSGEVYPEGAFQSRSIDDLVKNKYIEKVKK